VNGSDCIKEEDVTKIKEMLPRLESLEKERQIQESREKRGQDEKGKMVLLRV